MNTTQAVIVLVDDEPMVTLALASFLELETDHTVETFQDPLKALEYLSANRADVVVSDFMMPGMNGLQFLGEVRRLDPELPRILLTGYADKENAIRAINEVGLFQYLEKPLDNDLFMLTLNNAIGSRSLQAALLDKIQELDQALQQRDDLSARDVELQKEMDWARIVQQKFLPEKMPEIEGWQIDVSYRPAMAVGGDFYDFIPLNNQRWALVVADSAGHGVQAALGTALLRFATGSVKGSDLGPGEIMAALNQVVYQGLPREIPVAATVMVIDPANNLIRLVGGGLPQAMILEPDGQSHELPVTGLLLGLVDQELYTSGTELLVELKTGQRLLVFSDGLTEAQAADDQFFGEGPLAETLAPLARMSGSELVEKLADSALEFGLPEYRDDLTLLALGRSGS